MKHIKLLLLKSDVQIIVKYIYAKVLKIPSHTQKTEKIVVK